MLVKKIAGKLTVNNAYVQTVLSKKRNTRGNPFE